VAFAALPALAKRPQPQLTISEVFVDFDTDQIIITGEHFDGAGIPTVLLGEDPTPLTLISYGASVIVVELPADLPDGDYRLAVSTGQRNWQNDAYDLTTGVEAPQEVAGRRRVRDPRRPQYPPDRLTRL
jgi:hypothetical protein